MLRRALHRSDANRTLIVNALRAVGVKVYDLGEPLDLLTGWRGVLRLLELKDGDKSPSARKLSDNQEKFMAEWATEFPIYKVESISEAFNAHGIDVREV